MEIRLFDRKCSFWGRRFVRAGHNSHFRVAPEPFTSVLAASVAPFSIPS
jgi:hypothetical protein